VKAAGGNVSGVLRCSLSWSNYDDLDLHVKESRGTQREKIYFGNKSSNITSGRLDVDMNAGGRHSRSPVENVVWTQKEKLLGTNFVVEVNQFNQREMKDVGFDLEIEYDGQLHSFHYEKAVKGPVVVAEFSITKTGELVMGHSLPSTQSTKEMWDISTQSFQKVKMIMNSPNHWDGNKTGNRHLFFILDKCKMPGQARGFYNEFLKDELTEHRKVFEVLGGKLKVEESDNQLSGLGFSSTQRNSAYVKVSGSFNRVLKVVF
jgi:hypothetical protein